MDNTKITTIKKLIEDAQSSLASANSMLAELTGQNQSDEVAESAPKSVPAATTPATTDSPISDDKVVEGVFDGQSMIDAEGKKYPVPANYASKSKLVAGDILKLSIQPDGRFMYKQIGPVERKNVIGTLQQDGSQFYVQIEDKRYNVLLASVTYFKAAVGDQVTIIIPAHEDSDWACIENVLGK